MKTSRLSWLIGLGLLIISLTGCGPSPAQETATAQAAEALTLTAAPTGTASPSPTATSTVTPTTTITPTFTPVATPTITLTPTPDRVVPGIYYVSGCGSRSMPLGGTLKICISQVDVSSNDQHMIFYVTWTLSYVPSNQTVTKRSDEGNRNVYLTDNLGHRYDHIAGFGMAYGPANVAADVGILGMYDFGPAAVGAFIFAYHDEDNGILVDGIPLSPASVSTFGIVTYDNFSLDPYPLLLNYQKEIWEAVKAEDGSSKLVYKSMPVCTVQAQATHPPKGDFKSQIAIGEITYDIYGYLDTETNFYVREYIYVSGISGVDTKLKPFIYVTIPADTSADCIVSVSNLLSGLTLRKP